MRLKLAILLLLVGAAGPAIAQEGIIGSFAEGQGDPLSMRFFSDIFGCRLFPPPGTPCSDTQLPIIATVIGLFNLACLGLGTALLTWNMVAGISQTAHEGSVMGARWSSLWSAPRVFVAAAMLTPIPAIGDYNAIQAATAWLVRGGTAAATVVWASAADRIVNFTSPIVGADAEPAVEPIRALWQIGVCREVIAGILAQGGYVSDPNAEPWEPPAFERIIQRPQGGSPLFQPLVPADEGPWTLTTRPSANLVHPSSGTSGAEAAERLSITQSICGHVDTPPLPDKIARSGNPDDAERFHDAHRRALEAIAPGVIMTARNAVITMRNRAASRDAAVRDLRLVETIRDAMLIYQAQRQARLSSLAGTVVESGAQLGSDELNLLISGQHSRACRSDLTDQASPEERALIEDVCRTAGDGQGWSLAGTWYLHLARFNAENLGMMRSAATARGLFDAETSERVAERGVAEGLGWWQWAGAQVGFGAGHRRLQAAGEEAIEMHNRTDGLWDVASLALASEGLPVPNSALGDVFAAGTGDGIFQANRLKASMADVIARNFGPLALDEEPVVGLVSYGNWLINLGLGLLGGSAVGGLFGSGGGALAGIVDAFSSLAGAVGAIALFAGTMLAYVLPTLPFLFWTLAVTGYFVMVAEAILGVNLWAIAHLRMDGEGIAGESGRAGYFMALSVAVTPVLMIFGFLLGMAIFKATTHVLKMGMGAMLAALDFDQNILSWTIGMISVTIMMMIMFAVVAERSFSLITALPHRILQWIGASAQLDTGEAEQIRTAAVGGGGIIVRDAGRGVAPAARGIGQRYRAGRSSRAGSGSDDNIS